MIDNDKMIGKMEAVAKEVLPAGSRLWLYGSRARGEAREDSDWDLLVLLDKPELELKDYTLAYPFQAMGADMGQYISSIIYAKNEWEAQSFLPFYKNVERDKIELKWD